jgi:hypothetical protein
MASGTYIGQSTCENPEYTYVIACLRTGASWLNVSQMTASVIC